MSEQNKSEVARFRQRQAQEEQAAQRGFSGTAVVANHDAITKRMDRGAVRILALIHEGNHEEALQLLACDGWGATEEE